MCSTFREFDKVTIDDIDDATFRALKTKYTPLLHFGNFSLPKPRRLANELIWKWTEATGKYTGCPFWSKRAKALFDDHVPSDGGWPISQLSANRIWQKLNKKKTGGELRPKALRLTHEHVYPIKDIKNLFRGKHPPDREEIRELFDRQCVGCVVLESEHDRLNGHDANPWMRYADAKIMLADNPQWPKLQRNMIIEARILEQG